MLHWSPKGLHENCNRNPLFWSDVQAVNNEMLTNFVNFLNGKEGTGSHLVTVPPGPHLADALISSPVIQGEDGAGPSGAGFDFGVDPNEDPELALVRILGIDVLSVVIYAE